MYLSFLPGILPLFFLLFTFVLVNQIKKSFSESARVSLIVFSSVIVFYTEFLSLFKGITQHNLFIIWVVLILITLGLLIKQKRRINLYFQIPRLTYVQTTIASFLAVILMVTLFIALKTPPNNADSMTYHMSRVVHWYQNKSVSFYPTHIQRQLYQAPFGEFGLLTFYTLTGDDYFSLFFQWIFAVGSIFVVFLLNKKLGGNTVSGFFASVFLITLPMGIMQSTSAQNNYILSFFTLSTVYSVLNYFEVSKSKPIGTELVWLGMSMGLAILTKGTSYIFIFPFLIYFSLKVLINNKVNGIKPLVLVALIVISINISQWSRNYALFNSPLGPSTEGPGAEYMNQDINPIVMLSNMLKNLSLHVGTTTYIDRRLEIRITQFHNYIFGFDLGTPGYTWGTFFIPELKFHHEDLSGNLLHIILVFVTTLIFIFQKNKSENLKYYALCLLGSFMLFSLILRWQPWHSRLHLPLFVLFAPILGIVLLKYRNILYVISVVLIIGSVPYLFKNDLHPIVGKHSFLNYSRDEMYFYDSQHLKDSYFAVANYIKGTNKNILGIVWGGDDWEYPLLQLLPSHVMVHHININNNPSQFIGVPVSPDFIAVRGVNRGREYDLFNYNGKEYSKVLETTHVSLFELK